jgi:hypothetical protein
MGGYGGGQGWPVELGHEQAKVESLATACGLVSACVELSRGRGVAWRGVFGDGEIKGGGHAEGETE